MKIVKLAAIVGILILISPAAAFAGKPTITFQGDASAVTGTTATLDGAVNPKNATTTVEFEYGINNYNNSIEAIPTSFQSSTCIQHADFSDNKIATFPAQLLGQGSGAHQLQSLDLLTFPSCNC